MGHVKGSFLGRTEISGILARGASFFIFYSHKLRFRLKWKMPFPLMTHQHPTSWTLNYSLFDGVTDAIRSFFFSRNYSLPLPWIPVFAVKGVRPASAAMYSQLSRNVIFLLIPSGSLSRTSWLRNFKKMHLVHAARTEDPSISRSALYFGPQPTPSDNMLWGCKQCAIKKVRHWKYAYHFC